MRHHSLIVALVCLTAVLGVAFVVQRGQATADTWITTPAPPAADAAADLPARRLAGYTPVPPGQPAPRVIQWSPERGAEPALDAPIELVFDQTMDQASVQSAFQLAPATSGSFDWPDQRTLHFKPAAALERGQAYDVVLSQAARSAGGVPLLEPFVLRFNTVGFLQVSQAVPADGSSDVSPVGIAITVMFNRPVVPLAALEDQKGFPQPLDFSPPVSGHGEWVNTSVYVFTPAAPLAGGTGYRATVKAGLQDTTGGLLAADYSWSFGTLPPAVVWNEPADGAALVSVRPRIQVQFNMPVDPSSAQAAFRLTGGWQPVAGDFEFVGSTLTFTPAQQLEFGTTYQVQLAAGLRAASGGERGMPDDYRFAFTTVPLPAIERTEPQDGEQSAQPYTAFTIYFNAPIDPTSVLPHVNLGAQVEAGQVYTYYQEWANALSIQFGARPSTEYRFEITPGIQDPYGNRIDYGMPVNFRTAPLSPDFRLQVPDLVATYDASQPARVLVAFVNITRIDFHLYRLPPEMVTRSRWAWSDYQPWPADLVRHWEERLEAPTNQRSSARVELAEGGGRLEPGLYLLNADAPEVPGDHANRWGWRHVLVVSDLNLTMKSGPQDVLVWATRLDDGAPVADLKVSLFDLDQAGEQSLPPVTTDRQGVAYLSFKRPGSYRPYAYSTEPFAAVGSDWTRGVSAWDFGLPAAYGWNDARVTVYTDRPIYRPGQTVDIKGIVRLENDASYRLPDVGKIHVTVRDASDETVLDKQLPVNENGTFNTSLRLAEGAPLGVFSIAAEFNDRQFQSGFQVAAYRPPEFQVSVTPQLSQTVQGQPIQADAEVTYFFGGPVAQAAVQWNVLLERYVFEPTWGGSYTFTDGDDPWYCIDCWWQPPAPPTPIANGTGATDGQGRFQISLPADLKDRDGKPLHGSYRLVVEATVTGRDNQIVSGRGSLIVHQGDFYVGLRTRQYLGEEGKPFTTDLVAVDWQGQRLAGKPIEIQVYRREWLNQFVADQQGGGEWQWEQKDTLADTLSVVSDEKGEATATFTPQQPGTYRLVAQSQDQAGRAIRASVFVWVSGSEFVSWRRENNDRINLISDKSSYQPGETAEILIPSPYEEPQYALVSVERNHILRHEVIHLETNSTVYRLPIQPGDVPNIYVSVVLMKGSQADGKLAEYKVGILPLAVSTVAQQLQVSISSGQAQVEPGSEVEYHIQVTDAQGQPVQAELSLDVVDKAILSLLPRQSDALLEAFYSRRGLGIQTAAGLAVSAERVLQEAEADLGLAEPQSAGEALPAPAPMATAAPSMARKGAEAAAPPGVTLRQEFADTAYWNPVVFTDPQGKAQLSVKLPDNLTTWVMRGMAVNASTQLGEGLSEVVATKPLLIRPITPRFLVVEDNIRLAAAVSNNTGRALDVAVSLSSTGLRLQDATTQTIHLEAGDETTVRWQAEVSDAPFVDLVFAAVADGGAYSDASKPRLATGPQGTLAVYRYTAPDVVGTAGTLGDAGAVTELVTLPPKYDNQRGELSLQLDPSLAASIRGGLTYLEHYPYECTEQTVSRFLPNVLTYQALKELQLKNAELAARLPRLVEQGLSKLYAQQHEDGGWGWWSQDKSNVYITAYVAFAMLAARAADFPVRQDSLERGLALLEANIVPVGDLATGSEADRQAWVLYVLAKAQRAPVPALEELYANREKLALFARAYLALALQPGNKSEIKTLLSDFNNAMILSASGAHWEEVNADWWAMNSDTRSTAIILDALVQLDPQNALIPNVVRWLMVARKEAVWSTTQETAWALIALTDWLRQTGELDAAYTYSVALNGKQVGGGQVTADTVEKSEQVQISMAQLLGDAANRLLIERDAGPGRLYYTAHLKVFLPVEQLRPAERGIIVQRRYSLASCTQGTKCPEVREAKVGDVIRVDLTIIAPHDLHYLVVEDMLPAGAEAIDTGLATTSLLAMAPQLQRQPGYGGDTYPWYWDWWHWYSRSELRDEKVVLFADELPAGTYEYSYTMRASAAGTFHVIPAVASEFYFPDVFGRSDGRLLTIGQPD